MLTAAAAAWLWCASPGQAQIETPAELQQLAPEQLEVERVDPKKEKTTTLQFLKENREFLRSQLDLLRLKRRGDLEGEASLLDPRYAMFQEMLRQIEAARQTVGAEELALQRQQLLESITQLGDLEAQLDAIERVVDEQHARLGRLEEDFVGRQQTALVILVKGCPEGAVPTELLLTEEGQTIRVPMSDEQWAALRKGGVAQIYHALVEPREHQLAVGLAGEGWAAQSTHALTLEPERDRLTFLQLDLAAAHPGDAAPQVHSSIWVR